jgi:hypothetical protein
MAVARKTWVQMWSRGIHAFDKDTVLAVALAVARSSRALSFGCDFSPLNFCWMDISPTHAKFSKIPPFRTSCLAHGLRPKVPKVIAMGFMTPRLTGIITYLRKCNHQGESGVR